MAVDPLVNFQTALRKQLSRRLNDTVDQRRGFLGLLMAMDDFYGSPRTRFNRENDVSGPEVQFDFRTGIPAWAGVNHQSGALSVFTISDAEAFNIRGAKMGYSAYQVAENIRRSRINRHKNTPESVRGYVKSVAKGMRDGLMKKLDEDMFPLDNVENAPSSYIHAENRVMALSYPLQPDPGTGTYEYASIDLRASGYTGIQAVTAGDISGTNPFGTPTPSNIRTKLFMPLVDREASPDFALCDNGVMDYMIANAETHVVIDMREKLKFGGIIVNYLGLNWMPHTRLTQLAATSGKKREIIMGDSSTWWWLHKDMESDFDVLKVPGAPGKLVMQGYVECALVNESPRFNGRGIDVRLS